MTHNSAVPPDYLISTKSALGKTVLGTPIIVVVEAKRNDFIQGWGQCLAELVAIQRINDDVKPVSGIVTDGEMWQFGKLTADVLRGTNRRSQSVNCGKYSGQSDI